MVSEKEIKDRVLEELNSDYNGDIDNFLHDLDDRIEIGEYLNEKYNIRFGPVNVDFFKKQKDILNKMATSFECKNDKEDTNNIIINKAPHYNIGKYECIEVMRDVFGDEKLKTWCTLNAFKYIYRCYYKNENQDLQKAAYYLNYINKNLIDKEKND